LSSASDPGLPNLQAFCELLQKAAAGLRASGEALASRCDALEQAGLEGVPPAAGETGADVDADAAKARAAIEALERAAREALGPEPMAPSEALASAAAALETAGARLLAEGHEPAAAAVEELEAAVARRRQQAEAASLALTAGLEALRADLARAAGEASAALAQARERVQHESGELTRRAGRATEGWAQELEELRRGCREVATDLADFYREWGASAEDEADALLREAAEAGLEVADFVSTDGAMQLEAAARGALEEPRARLGAALAEAASVVTAVATAAWELEGLVPQLAICTNVVEDINRLLEELG
jgi:chromosome segregation ATPase